MSTPQFILDLRKKIGHNLLGRIGITAYVENDNGQVLLGRRADTGEWALVYGINEPGEEPAVTVVREVKEETGVDCIPVEFASVKSSTQPVVYANEDRAMYMDHLFICTVDPQGNGTPFVGDEESLNVGWFNPDDLPQPLAASTVERMGYVHEFKRRGDHKALFSL